jgi:alpha-glucuronidase
VNDLGRADWNPTYYHRADANGIGFERGPPGDGRGGSNATAQYAPEVAKQFNDVKQTPEQLLLWFHHLPWTYKVSSGRTLWDELVFRYTRGVEKVAQMQATWERMRPYVDPERFEQVKAYLAIQREEAQWWRDACIAYFQSINKLPLPAGFAPPRHSLEYYQALKFPYAPGRG